MTLSLWIRIPAWEAHGSVTLIPDAVRRVFVRTLSDLLTTLQDVTCHHISIPFHSL